jgi:hypothetical protein
MLKKILPIIPLLAYVALFWWWASLGYPAETQICNPPGSAENCESHNVLFAFAVAAIDKLNFYSALITALATGAIGYFTLTLKRSTDKLWDAGERQLRHLENTAERQLRAYIHTLGKDFLVQGDEHARFVNRFSVVNAGQTPAYKLKIDSVVKILPRPLPDNFAFDFIPEGKNRSMMMVGPGRSVGHDSLADAILSDEEMISIMRSDSGVRLYSFGTIRYEDCFGHPRFTNFCYFLEWEVTTEGYSFSVHPTEQHNDAN